MLRVAATVAKVAIVALAVVGLLALVLTGMIAVPISQPPALNSISRTARAVDRSDMPDAARFLAKDGTSLAVRHYPARKAGGSEIAVVIHGSSGSSIAVHALARALAERGVQTYVPDIRGHGLSGTRGDIAYAGQLQDDLADLVTHIRRSNPDAPLMLIGHSAGAGFALRMAGSSIQDQFTRTVLLAPFLGRGEPTNQPNSGGWAAPDLPRIIGLVVLNRLGILCCDHLPVVAFAVPPRSEQYVTGAYSFRLLRDFAASRDFRTDLATARRPVTIMSGAEDELMVSGKYQDTVGSKVAVKLLDGVNHMGIVSDTAAAARVADEIAQSGAKS